MNSEFHPVVIDAHSGYKADEYPRRMRIDDSWLDIIDIEDRWYSPGLAYFKVFAGNARRYLIRQDIDSREWQVKEI